MGQCCGRLWERLRDRWSHQRTNKYMQFGTRRQHDDESFLRELESDSEDDDFDYGSSASLTSNSWQTPTLSPRTSGPGTSGADAATDNRRAASEPLQAAPPDVFSTSVGLLDDEEEDLDVI
eukprot:m.21446 g.21446  ORF g.21446 m.21446 type:complete len:121 (-) comp3924_c0_seq1:219-581(-)